MNKEDNSTIIDFGSITDTDLYINEINDGCENDQNSSELNVSNISWASIVEEELGGSITDKVLTESLVNEEEKETTNCKLTDIEEILELDLCNLNDLEILEYQTFVSGNLRKNIRYSIDNYDTEKDKLSLDCFIKKLDWLMKTSSYLSKKLGMKPYKHESSKNNKLFPRSSYKFCNYNYECEFNYNLKKYKGCFAQHYVHNIVSADLAALIDCLNKMKSNNIEITLDILKELKKSTNTISYVTNHMFEELKNIYALLEKKRNLDELHINRTPSKRKNRRKRKNNKNKSENK